MIQLDDNMRKHMLRYLVFACIDRSMEHSLGMVCIGICSTRSEGCWVLLWTLVVGKRCGMGLQLIEKVLFLEPNVFGP